MKKYYFLIYGLLSLGIVHAQFTVLHNFNDTNGNPRGALTLVGKVLYGMTDVAGPPPYYGCIFAIDTDGSRYKVLHEFDTTKGYAPGYGSLTYAAGVLYGMTSEGGINNEGNIFSIDTNGNNYKDLFDFDSTYGAYPCGSLTFLGELLYGMTSFSGKHNEGNIFSIDTNGNGFKDLFDFSGSGGSNGAIPYGSLTLFGKVFYGMTSTGGGGFGNIFSIDTNGNGYKDLFDFSGQPLNGDKPYGALTLSGGVLYGMTPTGGANGDGSIFSIDTDGNGFNEMVDFHGGFGNGAFPYGSLTLSGSLLYGTTGYTIFSINTNGSGFKVMFRFNNTTGSPYGSLTLSGSTLYGMTAGGGTNGTGVIFKIDTSAVASVNNLTASKGAINVYPNPNDGTFKIQLSVTSGQSLVEIYNVLGEKVYGSRLNSYVTQISLQNQSTGLYFYRVVAEDGQLISSGKVIIQ